MFVTREQWLLAAVDKLRPRFETAGYKIPIKFKVSCGFPGAGNRRKCTGECWTSKKQSDFTHIFISPRLADEGGSNGVLNTLVHELIHSCTPEAGHKGLFKAAMKTLGQEGKAKSSVSGTELVEFFKEVVREIGPYPHRSLELPGRDQGGKKQTSRLLKVGCPSCGLTLRVTNKWIEKGEPICWLCGSKMDAGKTMRDVPEDTVAGQVSQE
jgi:hypothetical protein